MMPVSSNLDGGNRSMIFLELSSSILIKAPLPRYNWLSTGGFVCVFPEGVFCGRFGGPVWDSANGSFGRRFLSKDFSKVTILWRLSQWRSCCVNETWCVESM